MRGLTHGDRCKRVCSLAALAPDGELSALERRLLEAHLARCSHCRGYAGRVAVVVAGLRAAALEPLRRPVAVPGWRGRRVGTRLRAGGAAAAVAVMAIGIASRAPLDAGEREAFSVTSPGDRVDAGASEEQALRSLRRAAILAASGALDRPKGGSADRPGTDRRREALR